MALSVSSAPNCCRQTAHPGLAAGPPDLRQAPDGVAGGGEASALAAAAAGVVVFYLYFSLLFTTKQVTVVAQERVHPPAVLLVAELLVVSRLHFVRPAFHDHLDAGHHPAEAEAIGIHHHVGIGIGIGSSCRFLIHLPAEPAPATDDRRRSRHG
jgi:hypothetical protein